MFSKTPLVKSSYFQDKRSSQPGLDGKSVQDSSVSVFKSMGKLSLKSDQSLQQSQNIQTYGSGNGNIFKQSQQPYILSYSELMAIKDRSNLINKEDERKLTLRNEYLEKKKLNLEKNSIFEKVKKQDEKRYLKFEEIEIERRKQDEQERLFQEERKKEIIREANQKLFLNQDAVRTFKQALLLSDVKQEQEEILKIREQDKQRWKEYEQRHHEEILEQEKQIENKEKEKILTRLQKQKETNSVLELQLKEKKNNYIDYYKIQRDERKLIEQAAEKEKQENLQKSQLAKSLRLQNEDEIRKNKELLMKNIQEEKLIEIENEKVNEKYRNYKQNYNEIRTLAEGHKRRERQKELDKLYQSQLQVVSQKTKKQDFLEKIESKQEEMERKKEEEQLEKQKYVDSLKQQFDQQYIWSIEKKRKEQEIQKQQEKDYLEQLKRKKKELDELENWENYQKKLRLKEFREFQEEQINQNLIKKQQEFQKDFDDNKKIQQQNMLDKRVFQSYAEQCIDEWKTQGKEIGPMLLKLKKMRDEEDILGEPI